MEYKTEKLAKSTLTRAAAEAATAGWHTTKDKIERLEEMIHQYNEMAWMACFEDMETETNGKIDENKINYLNITAKLETPSQKKIIQNFFSQ